MAPHQWITVPIAVCAEYVEARRLEWVLYSRWGASLNAREQPRWLIKESYSNDLKSKRRCTRKPPWRKGTRDSIVPGHLLTRYTVAGESTHRFDLRTIMQAYEGKEVSVSVRPGYKDITDWREIRFWHGNSYLKIHREDGTQVTTTMKEWRPREEKARTPCKLWIRPEKSDAHDCRDMFKEIKDVQSSFAKMTDDELGDMWRIRNAGDRVSRVKYRKMLYLECEKRFDTVLRPVEVTLPFIKELDAERVKQTLQERIRQQSWPAFIKEWHCAKLRIKTAGQPSIGDILANVTRPSKIGGACVCDEVCSRMSGLPKTKGHIFFVGRDIKDKRTFNVCASNIPRQTWFDKFRAWEGVNAQLPTLLRSEAKIWKKTLFTCMTRKEAYQRVEGADEIPDTKEVYLLRKSLTGLVIGPLDKNNGELWACCPVLYHQALERNYSLQAGYEEIHTAKLSAYRKRRYTVEELPEQILRTKAPPENQRGGEKDIVELFQRIYKRLGWDKYAKFNRQGPKPRIYCSRARMLQTRRFARKR